jgi:hypothetical protein
MNVTATDLFFDDWRAYTYLWSSGMLGMAVGLFYAEPALWPAAAAMAFLFMTLTLALAVGIVWAAPIVMPYDGGDPDA